MSLDLGQILDQAGGYVVDLIESSGTEVSIRRNPHGTADSVTDPATLGGIDPEPAEPVASGLPALVIPVLGGGQVEDGPNLVSRLDAYSVLLLPEVTDVQEHDELTIDVSRDPRLVGRSLVVLRVADGTAGVVRNLSCEAAP